MQPQYNIQTFLFRLYVEEIDTNCKHDVKNVKSVSDEREKNSH